MSTQAGKEIEWKTLGGRKFKGIVLSQSGGILTVKRDDGKEIRLRADYELWPPAD